MTLLRSREIVEKSLLKSPPKAQKDGAIEPATPAKLLEPLSGLATEPTPAPCGSALVRDCQGLGYYSGVASDASSSSGAIRRRSLRLAAKSRLDDVAGNSLASIGKEMSVGFEYNLGKTKENGKDNVRNLPSKDELDLVMKEPELSRIGRNSELSSDLESSSQRIEKVRRQSDGRKRKLELDVDLSGMELEGEEARVCLILRYEDEVTNKSVEGICDSSYEVQNVEEDPMTHEVKADGGGRDSDNSSDRSKRNGSKEDVIVLENDTFRSKERFSREAKGKGKLASNADAGKIDVDVSSAVVSQTFYLRKGVQIQESLEDLNIDESGVIVHSRCLSREEKGKTNVIEDDQLPNVADVVEFKFERSIENIVPDPIDLVNNVASETVIKVGETNSSSIHVKRKRKDFKDRFRDIARQNASRFAHFSQEQEEQEVLMPVDREREASQREKDVDVEDWPGPFSTAMKIIRDREKNAVLLTQNFSLDNSKCTPVIWVPKRKSEQACSKQLAPSLLNLCLSVLLRNADAITSLEAVPDMLRNRLSQLLCDSRRMNTHFFQLLTSGSPTEICLTDCSWLSEEDLVQSFEGCDTCNLTVLQLDQCGRCLPDYNLFSMLSHLSNNLPALTTVSLKGACRLSDNGLKALVSCAPALRSVNLGQCSLLSSNSINILGDSLGSVLRKLYIDDCLGIDAMLTVMAFSKLKHLEVLSITGVHTVTDDFISIFIADCGYSMKELVLADCVKLTDCSMKIIAENCPQLCAIDISNLSKLTDSAIKYLSNGCHAIQKLKLCRNAFSDEAVAAYLEICGKSLKELSLNNVNKVAHHTALSLASHCSGILSLDLSWCRNLTNEALGLIVDSCLSLKVLKLFGCSQITNVLVDGHSNPRVQIIGLKMTSILDHLQLLDPFQTQLQ